MANINEISSLELKNVQQDHMSMSIIDLPTYQSLLYYSEDFHHFEGNDLADFHRGLVYRLHFNLIHMNNIENWGTEFRILKDQYEDKKKKNKKFMISEEYYHLVSEFQMYKSKRTISSDEQDVESSNLKESTSEQDVESSNLEVTTSEQDVESSNLEVMTSDQDVESSYLEESTSEQDVESSNLKATTSDLDVESSNLEATISDLEATISEQDVESSNLEATISEQDVESSNLEATTREQDVESSNMITRSKQSSTATTTESFSSSRTSTTTTAPSSNSEVKVFDIHNDAMKRQVILKDMDRLYLCGVENEHFKEDKRQEAIRNVLCVWCCEDLGLNVDDDCGSTTSCCDGGYKQGMIDYKVCE